MHFDKLYFITIGSGVDNSDGQYFCLYVDQDCAKNASHKKPWLTFSWIWWIFAHFELIFNFIATWSWEKTQKLKIPEIYVGCPSLIIGCKHTSLRVFNWSFRCPRPSLHIASLLKSKHESAITDYWPFGKTLQNSLQHKAKRNNYRFEWIRNPPSPTYWHQIWTAERNNQYIKDSKGMRRQK